MTKPNPDHQITICHADSGVKEYVVQTVDVASIFKEGHDQHTHEGRTDIIPAFEYLDDDGNTLSYPGLGDQAILNNGCVEPETTTTTTESTTTTSTSTTTTTVPRSSTTLAPTTTIPGSSTTLATIFESESVVPVALIPAQSITATTTVPASPQPESLAFTGADVGAITAIGSVILVVGVILRRISIRIV